jgi:hypothetical protein
VQHVSSTEQQPHFGIWHFLQPEQPVQSVQPVPQVPPGHCGEQQAPGPVQDGQDRHRRDGDPHLHSAHWQPLHAAHWHALHVGHLHALHLRKQPHPGIEPRQLRLAKQQQASASAPATGTAAWGGGGGTATEDSDEASTRLRSMLRPA